MHYGKVLVLGMGGFIGTHMVMRLGSEGYEVRGQLSSKELVRRALWFDYQMSLTQSL